MEVEGFAASDEYGVGEICAQSPAAKSKAEQGTVIHVTLSTGMETVAVPDLFGLTIAEAKSKLESLGLTLDSDIEYQTSSHPAGTVIGQSTNAEETLMPGDSVRITVSKEPVTETIKMPSLVGKSIDDAIDALYNNGLSAYRVFITDKAELSDRFSDMQVTEQSPASGMDILFDSKIMVDLYMYKADRGKYKAEFSENVTLAEENNDVIVTMITSIGEIVLYRGEYSGGTYSIPFTGRYWEKGSYTCVIYVNGEVYTSFIRSFD